MKNSFALHIRLVLWSITLIGISFTSFHFNSTYEEKESYLIESLEIVRGLSSAVVDYQLESLEPALSDKKQRELSELGQGIPRLKKLLQPESFGEKYFNESNDLFISYQQYLYKIKNSDDLKRTISFRKLKRELDAVDEEIYDEIKKVSMDKILWGAGGDFALILIALLGGIGISVFFKEEIGRLENTKRNLIAKLESSKSSLSGGAWSMDLESNYLDLSETAISLINMNIYEPHISFKNFLDYFTEETAAELKEQVNLCTKQGDIFSVELQKRGMLDESSWINFSGKFYLEGDERKVEGLVSDIDQLRRTEDRFDLLFSNIEQPAFIAGENGLWDCNRAALRFFKLKEKEDFLDKKLPELFPLNQPDGMGSLSRLKFHMKKSQQEKAHRFGWSFRRGDEEAKSDVQLFPIVKNGNALFLYVLKMSDKHISVIKNKHFKAILCDPNVSNRNRLQGFFEEEGWIVDSTESMAEALSLNEESLYDLIIFDLGIKDLNLELFSLKKNRTHLVGMGGVGGEDPLLRNKVDSYLKKPIMKEVVMGIIQKITEASEKLVVEDVLDLYSGRFDILISYCNELEIYLERFQEQFEKDLLFGDWEQMSENLLTLQTVSKKFSCRGLNQLFVNSFKVLKSRDISAVRENNKLVSASFQDLIRNLRVELGKRAA